MLAGSVEMPESPMSEVPPVLSTNFSKTASWLLRLHLPGQDMLAGSEEMPESPMSEVPPVLRTSFSKTTSWTLRLLTWTGHAGWVRGDAEGSHVGSVAGLEYQFFKDCFLDFLPGLDMLAGSEEMPESPMSEVPPVLRTSFSSTTDATPTPEI